MKFGVVTFPGSNCDHDSYHVLKDVMGFETLELWHKDPDLKGVDFVVLPGGFSYGDYLRSGAVARFSPIMNAVIDHARKGGYVMGICNGFQVLCEAHLLPGALLHNESHKFICKNVHLRVEQTETLISSSFKKGEVIKIPIAHAEGNYFAKEDVLNQLEENKQVLFRYCDESGAATAESNPNGSRRNIAGICNEKGNVFGMMPHPERAAEPVLGNEDGRRLFESILASV